MATHTHAEQNANNNFIYIGHGHNQYSRVNSSHTHSWSCTVMCIHMKRHSGCRSISVCASCVSLGPLDLSFSARRPHWTYGRWSQRSRPGTRRSVFCALCRICVCWRAAGCLGTRCARIIEPVMEGVHEEFRLALRENKWEARPNECGGKCQARREHRFCPENYCLGAPQPPALQLSSI